MVGFTSLRQKLAWTRACSQAVGSYLEVHKIRKLQLGTGTNVLDGWFNTDITPASPEVFYLDTTKRFPFDDALFDYIFSEHHIEHIAYGEGLFTLQECYRVLKPGGKIRLATPNLEVLLSLYTPEPDEQQRRYIKFITRQFLPGIQSDNPVFVINNAFHNWGHQFLYDRALLQHTLEEVGFAEIAFEVPGVSKDAALLGIERHGQFIGDEEINRFETMVVEGKRPICM